MEVRSNSKGGPQVACPTALVNELAAQVRAAQAQWLRQLRAQPERFADLEVSIHQTFQSWADQLVAGLLAQATQDAPALEAAKKK
jgi:hypothetical protein